MLVHISAHLFSKPEAYLTTGDHKEIRQLAKHLGEHLPKVADAVQKLQNAGKLPDVTLYDVNFMLDVPTEAAAQRRLEDLGIDPNLFIIWPCEGEEEEDRGDEDVEGDDEVGTQ
jgi:hypothetical protein